MKFELILFQKDIKKTYKQILTTTAKQTQIKGFRKGKAPIHMIEEQLEKNKVQEEIVNRLLPTAYVDYLKEHNLKPIGQPSFKPVSLEKEKDWVVEAEIAQKPDVDLGNYQQDIKTAFKTSKPKKGSKEASNKDSKVNKIFDVILVSCKVEAPDLLVHQEAHQRLHQLESQLSQSNISLEQYSKSIGKTVEQIQKEYHQTAIDRIRLEFILNEIQAQQKITISDKELDKFIENIKDETTRNHIKTDQSSQLSIRESLEREKVIKYLTGLTKA